MGANKLAVSRDPVFAAKKSPSTPSFGSLFQRTSSAPIVAVASSPFAPPAGSAQRQIVPSPSKAAQPATKAPGQGRYRALVNRVRKERLKRLAILSWIAGLVALYASLLNGPSTLFSFVSLALPLAATVIWAGAVVPIVLLKVFERSQRKELSDSRVAHYRRLFGSLRAAQVFTVSLVSGLATWAGYVLAAMRLQADSALGPFVTVRGRQLLQYNERPFYLLFSQLVLSCLFAAIYVAREKGVVTPLASPFCPPIKTRIVERVSISLPASLRLLFVSAIVSPAIYLVVRHQALPYLVLSPLGARLLRPRLIAVLRRSAALSLGIHWRVLMQGSVFVAVWDVVSALWEVYDTQPREVVKFDKEPNKVLLDGLLDPKTQHMALMELAQIALDRPEGRLRIYSDVRGNPRPFNAMAKECLRIIDDARQMTDGRGVLPGPAPASLIAPSAPSTPGPSRARPPSKASPVKTNVNVFRPAPKKSILSRLVSSNDPAAPTSAPSDASATTASGTEARLPSLFRSPSAPPNAGPSQRVVSRPAPARGGGPSAWDQVLPQRAKRSRRYRWWVEPLWEPRVVRCVPTAPACMLAADALSGMLSASLKEDPYGTAQVDIVPTFESLVTCLESLEALESGLQKEAKTPEDEERLRRAIWDHLRPVQTCLSGDIASLLTTFGPFLREMRFSHRVTKRLEAMLAVP